MQQSSSPKADVARSWLDAARERLQPKGAGAQRQWAYRAAAAAAVLLAYLVIAGVTGAGFSEVYTAKHMAAGIGWFFIPVGVLLALAGLLRAAGWSVVAYLLATTIGEMIGTPIYQFQYDYVQAQLKDPAYVQDWDPIQPALWIAIGLYLYIACAAAFVDYRALSKQ